MSPRLSMPSILFLSLLAGGAAAGDENDSGPRIDAVDHAERMKVHALMGGEIGTPLPPVYADSPRDSILYADRFPVNQSYQGACDGTGPTILDHWIPKTELPTGKGEYFRYMVPTGYDPQGAPAPLVIGYHGYGNSAASVANQSTMDEEADARGWFFLAPTGLDDKLFGSPSCQIHIDASIDWMMDNFNIDPDRIYMVGYSMGGGVAANYASRHRDPDGHMIAAMASACGTFDWTLAYEVHPQQVKDLLVNPFNFGGTPAEVPFNYQQGSSVYFEPTSYPPTADDYISKLSMGSNMASIPTYVTFDTQDEIFSVRQESQAFINLMEENDVQPISVVVTGSTDPCTGSPAPHSWAVFDMPAVFNFLDGKVANRYPDPIYAQLDRTMKVSYLDVTQTNIDAFSWLTADSTSGFTLTEVENVETVDVDATLAGTGLDGVGPIALDVTTPDANGHTLRMTGFDAPPAYLLDSTTTNYVPGTHWDPLTETMIRDVDLAGLDADLVTDTAWSGDFYSTPDPAPIGGVTNVEIDLPPTSATAFFILALQEGLVSVKGGNKLTALPFTPSLLLLIPTDAGDLSLPLAIPNDPGLIGVELFFQAVGLAGSDVDAITNMWVMTLG